jgi:hypothetical protein
MVLARRCYLLARGFEGLLDRPRFWAETLSSKGSCAMHGRVRAIPQAGGQNIFRIIPKNVSRETFSSDWGQKPYKPEDSLLANLVGSALLFVLWQCSKGGGATLAFDIAECLFRWFQNLAFDAVAMDNDRA